MSDDSQATLRKHVLALLAGRDARMTFDDAVVDFPAAHFNTKPENVPYTPWHILEHLRLTQLDILEFIRPEKYVEKAWPADYWPAHDAVTDQAGWDATIAGVQKDLAEIEAIVGDPGTDLFAVVPNGDAPHYTFLREANVVADHNSYHIGEFGILRQVMGTWPDGHT
ncbi:MAG TPA: DinB family protein [Thermomicrobiales bacterium]|nr:DinB family protein [Thermomicrobiales bacterium]